MHSQPSLHKGYERLMGSAVVNQRLASDLLHDPRGTALAFGLTPSDAEMVADIRVNDLRTFAAVLLPRLYGKATPDVLHRRAAAG